MAVKEELNVLLNKKMDRKDFLKHVAIGVVALTGITAITRAFIPTNQPKVGKQSTPTNNGYGASAYGGTKTS